MNVALRLILAEQWWPGNVASVNMAERKVLLIYETSALPPTVLMHAAALRYFSSLVWEPRQIYRSQTHISTCCTLRRGI